MIKVTAPKNRSVHLASTTGAARFIPAGESKVVPDYFAQLAAQKQCAVQPVDTAGQPEPELEPEPSDEERIGKILDAVKTMVDGGDPKHFTSTGYPKKQVVQQMVGARVTANEIQDAYNAVTSGE